MPTYLPNANLSFLPEQVGELVVIPVTKESVAAVSSTVILSDGAKYRVPIVAADPDAGWTKEGDEIVVSDPDLDELVINFYKVAGLVIVSNEIMQDTSPAAAQIIGQGLTRKLTASIDGAFFGLRGAMPADPVQPAGLENLTGITTVAAGAAWSNTDAFVEAVYAAAELGAEVGSFIAHPTDALALAKIKEESGSNRSLLTPDATKPGSHLIAGVPLRTSPAVTAGHVWGISPARSLVVVHKNATVDIDRSAYFSSDRTGIRATLRVGFGWPQPNAVVKIIRA